MKTNRKRRERMISYLKLGCLVVKEPKPAGSRQFILTQTHQLWTRNASKQTVIEQKRILPLLRSVLFASIPAEFVDSSRIQCSQSLLVSMCATDRGNAGCGSVSGYQLSRSLAHRFDQPAVLMSQQRRSVPCRPTLEWATFHAAQIRPCIFSQLLKILI